MEQVQSLHETDQGRPDEARYQPVHRDVGAESSTVETFAGNQIVKIGVQEDPNESAVLLQGGGNGRGRQLGVNHPEAAEKNKAENKAVPYAKSQPPPSSAPVDQEPQRKE